MEQCPGLGPDPFPVSSSESLESTYEVSESESSLLASSEWEGGMEVWPTLAPFQPFLPPELPTVSCELDTTHPLLRWWPRPLLKDVLLMAQSKSYFSRSI